MLSDFTLNVMDTFNILYLWIILTKRENNLFKLISSVVIISILITITDHLGLNFIITYIMDVIIIKIIYKRNFKNIIFELLLTLLIVMLIQLILFIVINKFVYDPTIQNFTIESIVLICLAVFSKLNLFNKNFTIEKITNDILFYFILTSIIYVVVLKFICAYNDKLIMDNLLIISAILGALIISQVLTYLYVVKVIKEKEALKISNEYNSGETSHLTVKNQIVNPNNINLNEMFTRSYTTKNTIDTRGYGLHNVQKIVKLHKGNIEFYVECETIIFDIYFNNSSVNLYI